MREAGIVTAFVVVVVLFFALLVPAYAKQYEHRKEQCIAAGGTKVVAVKGGSYYCYNGWKLVKVYYVWED
jgi:uncharacterized protein YpmB